MASNRGAGLFSHALSSLKKEWRTGNRISRSNTRTLQIETFEKRHLLASVTGTVMQDFTGNGPSPDDLAMGGVAVELYRDADHNGLFDESVDLFIAGQVSEPTSGVYAFDGLSDGRHFLRQVTPDGFHQVGGPEVFTFDVAGAIVGLVVDDFRTPDPYQVYNISDEYSAPLVVEADDPGILGGQRDLLVEIDGDPTTVSTQIQIGTGQGLRLASASPGTTITLQYDGVDVDPTDQLSVGETFASPIDLTVGGANTGLRIDFDMVEAGISASEMDIRITATGQTGSAEYVGTVPEANDPSFFVPFTSFTGTGGFSFVALSSLQVVLNESAEPDVDFNLETIIAENPDSAGFDFTNFAGHSVGGVKVEDLTGDGFSEDDQPLGGVTIELYGDTDGDRQFDENHDTLLATTITQGGTGAYAFDGLGDGRYFIREVVPVAMNQTDGLEVYTLDISGEFVGLLVDDFAAPEIIEVLQIEDTHLDPTLLESSAAAILGGQRDLLVDVLGNATVVSAQVQVGGAEGLKLASSSPGTLIGLQYDGVDSDPADALSVGNTFDSPIDLTGGGTNTGLRIDFGVLEAGIGVTEMDFSVRATSPGGTAEFSGMLSESADPSYFLPFTSFVATGTFSFAELTSLQFMFNENGTEDVDFAINAILAENPTRRGFDFANYGHGSAIDIEKSTNGEDADVGPGPMVAVGDAVTWSYTITNTGLVELFNVHVSDDQVASLTLISSGNGDDLLSVGETWTYQAIGQAVEGQYANLATVTAMDPHEQVVSDEDPSHYFGVASDIDIEKSTNGQDADIEMGPMVAVGDRVTWMYTVTNMGNVDLFDVVVTDDQGATPTLISGDDGDLVLNVGETWLFEATGTAIEGQYANLATVTALDIMENQVSDEDPSHYFGVTSGIDIEKSTNGHDADSETGPLLAVGEPVIWIYTVTNTGNVDLFDVVVTDDQGVIPTLASGDDGNLVLNVGETWVFTVAGVAEEGQYANLATVTAIDLLEQQVSDEDPSHYFGVASGIDIEKSTNGQDADIEMGPIITVGGPVTWMYTVTNLGNVDLFDVVVTDDQGVIPTLISGDDGDLVLNVGEKWLFEATGTAIEGQYANLGSVTALDVLEDEVTDEDPSHYFGVVSGIDIEKSTNGHDADIETGPLVAVGSPVTWMYTVTNTGNVDLFGVVVTDDQGIIPIPITGDDGDRVLNVGETWIFTARGVAEEGQYANLATVTAIDLLEQQVSDEDPSHYFGVASGIDIEKSTNGHDADTPTGPVVTDGFAVAWDYLVTNTGNVVLSDVVVTDDNGTSGDPSDDFSPTFFGGDSDGNGKLDPGETWIFAAAGVASQGQYANLATVTAIDLLEQQVSDEDPSHYFGILAGIDIEKWTNGQDADTETGPFVAVGQPVIWTYTVTNTSNVDLLDVLVADDQGEVPTLISGDDGDGVLNVGETWVFTAAGVAEEGQYANLATVTAIDSLEQEVSDEDPSHYFGVVSSIDIEKSTNGHDADSQTGPLLPVGDPVTWTYTVTNLGNVDLLDVVVIDDQGVTPTFISGDDGDGVLNVGETWLFEAAGTAIEGQYANLATVTALDVLENQVSDEDPSHYFGVVSGIDIEKSTNGQDADIEMGPMVAVGNLVTWMYTVTNMGNVDLFDVAVIDDQGAIPTLISGDDGDGVLNVGEEWLFEATGAAIEGQYANLATVTALDVLEDEVTDEDPSHYFGVVSGIDIEKSTNDEDADTGPGPSVAVGEPVIWTYTVTNMGNVDLFDVVVIDDQGEVPTLTSGDDGDGVLNVGETWLFKATGTAIEGQYANLATVTAIDLLEQPISDEDPSHYFGIVAGIDIEKWTNGQDADTPTGPVVTGGFAVVWDYLVTNTGNVVLSDVVVTDDNGTPGDPSDDFSPTFFGGDSDGNGQLDPGETWNFQTTAAPVMGQYGNEATVVAYDPFEQSVSDSDPSHYFGVAPEIDIEKATNGLDADTPTGPEIPVGETLTWTYTVTNPGDVALDDVQVTDDNGTPGDTSDDFILTLAGGDTNGDGLLDPDETWIYEATGTAEEGQYGNIAEVEAKVVVVGGAALAVGDSDPSHYFGILSGIDVEKATNGQDADTETGPIVAAGDQVTWTYAVTNTGNGDLFDVTLIDDQGLTPVYQSGDDNNNTVLDIGETWLYEATGTAVAGQYANLATATATDSLVTEVSDQDPSHYFGILSAIDIEKSTNGLDADTETGPMVPVGNTVTWTYEVTNTGNAALTNVVVSDDQGVIPVFQSGDDGNGVLDPGETWIYQANGTAEPGQYANLAVVTAIDLRETQVADEDPSHYFGYTAAVELQKSTNGQDADTPTGPLVPVGQLVTWLYEVTNTGNLGFDDVAVTDDQGVFPTFQSGDNGDGVLDPGETWVFRATGIATAGQYRNLGTVVAKGPDDIQATDEDPSYYFGVVSSIDIEKSTNGQDADSPQGPILVVGNPVTWTYNVTNTGNVDLGNVVVTDDQGVVPGLISDGNGDAILDIGETWVYQAAGTAEEGQYANLGTVTAIDPLQGQVTDKDQSHYFGQVPNNSSLSGYVYNDVNNDGFFAMGVEQPIPNTKIILVGIDLNGVAINQDTTTDADGYYEFTDLPAGTYRLFELQPSAYLDGKDTIGTPGGDTADDEFSNIDLPADYEGKENNFGERGLKPEYSSKQYLLWPPGTWGLTYDGHNSDPQAGPISPEVYAASTAVAPRTTPIVGTPGDDLLEVYAGDWTVTLNGEVIEVDPQSTSLQFDGFMGEDTVILHGTDGDDTVTLDADGAKLVGSNYTITISDAEKITVDGHGGSNRAVIHDSPGHDLLKAKASWAMLIGEGFEHTLWGFSDLQATATEGYDVAMIYDSPGDDRLVAHPTNATFSGDGFELKFDYFNGLHAYGTSTGYDVAELYDSAADDTFVADAKQSALFAPGYYNRAKYFEEVIAHATTGNDQAWLFDSAGNDLLEAADDWARLTIAGRTSEIEGFDTVRADSSQGGQDNKKLDAVDFLMFTDGPWLDQ